MFLLEIVLIQLTNPIPLSSTIQPVKLPTDCGENISSYEDVIAAGTGLIECDHTDGILHEVDLKTFPCEECEYVNTMADLRTVIFTKQKSTKSDCSKGSPFRGDSGNFELALEKFYFSAKQQFDWATCYICRWPITSING